MNLALSYFYQIRFFKPYMIPISTAMFDPKWFHQNKGNDFTFVDKNGIINGIRIGSLRPKMKSDGECYGREKCKIKQPTECSFLKNYEAQLNQINFDLFEKSLNNLGLVVKDLLRLKEDPLFVFIVYEAPDNHCSEREIILKVLKEHGYNIEELKYPISKNY